MRCDLTFIKIFNFIKNWAGNSNYPNKLQISFLIPYKISIQIANLTSPHSIFAIM
jgi:hypothetical protein